MRKLQKPISRLPLVRAEKAKEFLEEFNKNKISEEFRISCQKAEKLFRNKKQNLI